MLLGNALCIYGLILLAYGIARVSVFATRLRHEQEHGTQSARPSLSPHKRTAGLPQNSLYLGFAATVIGTLLSVLTSWYVHPLLGWLGGIAALSALTVWGVQTIEANQVSLWPAERHRIHAVDRSNVPAELAEILHRKTGLARRPNESDYDYVHRAREHVERKLARRFPDADTINPSTLD